MAYGYMLTYAIVALATCFIVYKQWQFLSFHFLPPSNSLQKYQRNPTRAWALITGASAGIGLGHAQELTANGFGVILLGHKEWELDEAITTIKAEFSDAACEKLVLDATTSSHSAIVAALHPFMTYPITILVNNVVVQPTKPLYSPFESYTPAQIAASINANNLFMCNVTHILYPVLKRNGPSLIISLSSGSYFIGLPLLAMYTGTKAFVDAFSRSLWREARLLGHPIDCLSILPGDVRSQGNVYGLSPRSPDARLFARMVLERVGFAVRRGYCWYSPYWVHALELVVAAVLPERVVGAAVVATMERRVEAERKAM